MGRGSYLGGSTIIGPRTNWSDDGFTPVKKSKKKQQQQIRTLTQIKLDFLNLVIDSELNGALISSIPKKSRKFLEKKVSEKGGIERWAKSQPQYNELKDKKVKRKNKQNNAQAGKAPP